MGKSYHGSCTCKRATTAYCALANSVLGIRYYVEQLNVEQRRIKPATDGNVCVRHKSSKFYVSDTNVH